MRPIRVLRDRTRALLVPPLQSHTGEWELQLRAVWGWHANMAPPLNHRRPIPRHEDEAPRKRASMVLSWRRVITGSASVGAQTWSNFECGPGMPKAIPVGLVALSVVSLVTAGRSIRSASGFPRPQAYSESASWIVSGKGGASSVPRPWPRPIGLQARENQPCTSFAIYLLLHCSKSTAVPASGRHGDAKPTPRTMSG